MKTFLWAEFFIIVSHASVGEHLPLSEVVMSDRYTSGRCVMCCTVHDLDPDSLGLLCIQMLNPHYSPRMFFPRILSFHLLPYFLFNLCLVDLSARIPNDSCEPDEGGEGAGDHGCYRFRCPVLLGQHHLTSNPQTR